MKKQLFFVVVLVFFLSGCSGKSEVYFAEIPYGVEFGYSYDDLLKLDADAGTPEMNDAGTAEISPHRDITGDFLGYKADDLSIALMYNMGTDDALESVLEQITIPEKSGTSGKELFDSLDSEFSEQYGKGDSGTPGRRIWNTSEGISVTLVKWDDSRITITWNA